MREIHIYTDGGARGNPGPAGAGAVIQEKDGTVLAEVSEYLGERTNNWAEYEGAILALKKAKATLGEKALKETKVTVYLDSELVCKQMNGEYQIKEKTLFPQFIALHNLRVQFPNVSFVHVRREENIEADHLANTAMDRGV